MEVAFERIMGGAPPADGAGCAESSADFRLYLGVYLGVYLGEVEL